MADRPTFGGRLLDASPLPEAELADNEPLQSEINRRYALVQAQANKLNINGEIIHASPADLREIGPIGCGSCGHVTKVKFRGQLMAVKTMAKTENRTQMKRILMDLDVVLKAFDCEHIVHSYGYFITDERVMVCMELMATSLDRILSDTKNQPVPEPVIGKIACSVLDALNYLKEHHSIIHRDVKPSNILLDWSGNVKLCDFGISGNLIHSRVFTRQEGCPPYMAPERLNPCGSASYDVRSDVWSLGLTLVELARGRYPYQFHSEFECFSAILDQEPPILKTSEGFSPDFVNYVSLLLKKNVEERPKYDVLLKQPFILRSREEETDVASWLENIMSIK